MGGGEGYSIIIYAYWVCAARETPIFSPKFPVRSIIYYYFFYKCQKFRSDASPSYSFCRSGDHNFRNFFTFWLFIAAHSRLTQPSSPSSLRSPAFSRPSSLRCPPFFTLPRHIGLTTNILGEYPRVPQPVSETRIFTLEHPELAPEPRIFMLELAPVPPIFHFAAAHTYQNFG